VLPEIELIRREAFADLDKAVVHILRNTLSYLDNTDTETDETSLKTYNYYVRRDKLNE
jgi:HD superfamily phosphohydrolase YqeK